MCLKNIQDPRFYYENSPDLPLGVPRWSEHQLFLRYYWAQRGYNYVLFMCVENIQDGNRFLKNFPRSHHELWLEYRFSLRYIWMRLCNIHVLFTDFKNIIDPNFYFENLRRLLTYGPPFHWSIVCLYDTLECNIQEFNRYFKKFPDLIFESYAPSKSYIACLCNISNCNRAKFIIYLLKFGVSFQKTKNVQKFEHFHRFWPNTILKFLDRYILFRHSSRKC